MNKISSQLFEEMVQDTKELLHCTPGISVMPNILFIIGRSTKGMELTWQEEKEIAHHIMDKVRYMVRK